MDHETIRLQLRFPSGRYHATPWNHHVNEAVAEWPPAPFRIVRALAAALFERCPELDRDTALSALGKLITPPSYTLPRSTSSHTRHYLSKNQMDRSATALAFDAFVAVDRQDSIWIHWPTTLSVAERRALATLVSQVSYLGRAESWCEMRLLDEDRAPSPNCHPHSGSEVPGHELVPVLCPALDLRSDQILQTTAHIQQTGYAQPPGTRWVPYVLPSDQGMDRSGRLHPVRLIRPEVAEFALGGTVLPLFTDGIRVAEIFRRAALSLHRTQSMTLAGKDADGVRRLDHHQHAHYLPQCRDGSSRRVTHMLVYAPCGFTEQEQRALTGIRFLRWQLLKDPALELAKNLDISAQMAGPPAGKGRESGSVDVVLCGFGNLENFAPRCEGQKMTDDVSSLLGEGRVWRSRTPFVLPRFAKGKDDGPEDQIRQELSRREHLRAHAASVEIRPLEHLCLDETEQNTVRWIEFRRWRQGDSASRLFGGFELRFSTNVQGPILLGYGSHFGLGRFIVASR